MPTPTPYTFPLFNGPSGIALDKQFIHPLGLTRDEVWLSDLINIANSMY